MLELRRDFASFFTEAERRHVDVTRLPAEFRERFVAVTKTEFAIGGLSDSIVIAVPLNADDMFCTAMNSLELMIFSICHIAMMSFAIGIVFRGGLDVGQAARIGESEVYGPALARAYHLESEVAEYPRFLVGNELLQFLERVASQETSTEAGDLAKGVAVKCRRTIVQDTDGRQMLDFLGREVRSALGPLFSPDLVTEGRRFIESEYKKFQQDGNEKLASRYYRLLQYYLARKEA